MKPYVDKATMDMVAGEDDFHIATDELGSDTSLCFPFDCPPMDIPLGGGLLSGRVYEIFGAESNGKTSLALEFTKNIKEWVAKVEQKGWDYNIFWIESESAIDKVRAAYMGVPISKFIFKETDIFEEGRDAIKRMLTKIKDKKKAGKDKYACLMVWDTIAATSTKNEKEYNASTAEEEDVVVKDGEDDKKKPKNPAGLTEKPRLMKSMFRDITGDLGETNTSLILVNQVFTQIGRYGAPLDSGGGMALRHHTSARMKVTRVEDGKEVTQLNGIKRVESIICQIEFKKNKLTGFTDVPVVFVLNKDSGIDKLETRMLFLKKNKLIPAVSGGWTTWKIPAGYADKTKSKDGKPFVPGQVEIKWQTNAQLNVFIYGTPAQPHLNEEGTPAKYPHLIDWMDYLIYSAFANSSPVLKVKTVKKVWEYEEKFFGVKRTILNEREIEVARLVYSESLVAQKIEEEKEKESVIKKNNKNTKKLIEKVAKEGYSKEKPGFSNA